MSAAVRSRLAHGIAEALRLQSTITNAESAAAHIDGGIGLAAVASIKQYPPGPRRDFEIATWVRRAQGVDTVATLITPGMSEDDLDALTDFHVALRMAS